MRKDDSCGNLSLSNWSFTTLVAATSADPLLAGTFWAPRWWRQAGERNQPVRLDEEHNQAAVAGGQGRVAAARRSRPRRRGLGPGHLVDTPGPRADRRRLQGQQVDITGIAPVGYMIFAMALGTAPARCCGAPCRAGRHARGLRRHPGAVRAVAPAALHDPGHRVLQAQAPSCQRVLPECAARASSARTASPGRHREQLRVRRRTDPAVCQTAVQHPHPLHPAWRRTATGGT